MLETNSSCISIEKIAAYRYDRMKFLWWSLQRLDAWASVAIPLRVRRQCGVWVWQTAVWRAAIIVDVITCINGTVARVSSIFIRPSLQILLPCDTIHCYPWSPSSCIGLPASLQGCLLCKAESRHWQSLLVSSSSASLPPSQWLSAAAATSAAQLYGGKQRHLAR